MDTYGVDLMGRRRRRRHSAEFKATVIQECITPGLSIASVALAHGLNANLLRKWVIDAEQVGTRTPPVAAPELGVSLFHPAPAQKLFNACAAQCGKGWDHSSMVKAVETLANFEIGQAA